MFNNNVIHNRDTIRDIESYCRYEKLSLVELKRDAHERLKSKKVGILKRCTILISNLFL